MTIAMRTAETIWSGPLASGNGTIRPATGALGELTQGMTIKELNRQLTRDILGTLFWVVVLLIVLAIL